MYDVNGSETPNAFRIDGVSVYTGIDTGLPKNVSRIIDDAMAYCNTYVALHPKAYAFPQINDVHLRFGEKEPAYITAKYPQTFSRFMMLGDITNTYDATQLDNAVSFMGGAAINKLVAVGNHELGEWAEGDTLPQEWYKNLLDQSSVLWNGGDGLIYYSDDDAHNVRYIVLDSCTPIYRSSGVQLFTKNELEWCASVMESAGDRDIIICNHAMGASFYLASDAEKTTRIYDTTVTNASTVLFPMIRAFIAKETFSVTDDEGVIHAHDFSRSTGDFIGYFSGHYHHAGVTNENGFWQFTGPTLGSASSTYMQGMGFFIVDPDEKKIIWLVCGYAATDYIKYEYSYA